MLGVDHATIGRDINPGANAPKQKPNLLESKVKNSNDGANAPRLSPITQSPSNVWNDQEKKAENEIKKEKKAALIKTAKSGNLAKMDKCLNPLIFRILTLRYIPRRRLRCWVLVKQQLIEMLAPLQM